jgi:hypothetical protein
MKTSIVLAGFALCAVSVSPAAVIQFDLIGSVGVGLLAGNQGAALNGNPGSGGEIGAGITYDDVTQILNVNVGWGSANGFINLTGNATAAHIHGLTASAAPASFNEIANVLIGLDGPPVTYNPSASAGSITGSVHIGANETALYDGRLYINVHTAANTGGEIRGQLIRVIPEPSLALLASLGASALALRRRRA